MGTPVELNILKLRCPYLPVPVDDVLIARQVLKPHGTPAVQLLCADTDLRTEVQIRNRR